jgi:hypothetical protein
MTCLAKETIVATIGRVKIRINIELERSISSSNILISSVMFIFSKIDSELY